MTKTMKNTTTNHTYKYKLVFETSLNKISFFILFDQCLSYDFKIYFFFLKTLLSNKLY